MTIEVYKGVQQKLNSPPNGGPMFFYFKRTGNLEEITAPTTVAAAAALTETVSENVLPSRILHVRMVMQTAVAPIITLVLTQGDDIITAVGATGTALQYTLRSTASTASAESLFDYKLKSDTELRAALYTPTASTTAAIGNVFVEISAIPLSPAITIEGVS